MEIYKGKELVSNCKVLKGLSNFRGLMFSSGLVKGESVLLTMFEESRVSSAIHMLFVFFPIDVVWLNSNLEIVDVKKNIKPFSLYVSPKKAAKYVLEMRSGESEGLSIGDFLSFG